MYQEHVERLGEVVVVVIELQRAVQPENGLHPVRVVAHEGVDDAGAFVDVSAWPGHPVVFEIAPASLEHVSRDRATMAMPAELAPGLHPEHDGERVIAHVEGQMA